MALSVLMFGCPAVADDSGGGTSSTTNETNSDDAGSEGDDSDDGDTSGAMSCSPTEESIRAAIFEPHCATPACHDSETAAGALDLAIAELGASLVGAPSGTCDGRLLIVAGDPGASFLREKLEPDPSCGAMMPSSGTALTDEQLGCIDAWIEQLDTTCETCGTGTCIELQSSADHCGACNAPCPASVACVSGSCNCPGNSEPCDGGCVDTQSSPAHCGGCGQACDPSQVCLAGGCADDCGSLVECSAACVDPQSDPLHCGGCDAPCDAGQTCTDGACGCAADPLSYTADIEPILVPECATAGCHRPMGPTQGAEDLNLETGAGYDALVDVPSTQCTDRLLVEPGNPAASYLYDKLLGVDLCSGTKMPKSGPSLTATELQSVSDWICSGAAE